MSLKSVSVEEKSEFERYLVGIGIKDGKPTSVSSLLNDQYLREFLTELTFPVYNVKDFDKLSQFHLEQWLQMLYMVRK